MFKPLSSNDGTFYLGPSVEDERFTPKAMFKLATNISSLLAEVSHDEAKMNV